MVEGISDHPPSSVIDVFCPELCCLRSSSLVRHRGQPGGYPVQPDLHPPAFSLCAWGGSWRDQGLLLPMSHLLWNRCGKTDQSNAFAWSKQTLCCHLSPDQDYFSFNLLLTSEIFLVSLPSGANHRSAQVLILLVIPGHVIFLYTIHLMKSGHTTLTPIFMSVYLAAALLQVSGSWNRYLNRFTDASPHQRVKNSFVWIKCVDSGARRINPRITNLKELSLS